MDAFFDFDLQNQSGDRHTFIYAKIPRHSSPSIPQERNMGSQRYFVDMLLADHFQSAQQGNSNRNRMF